MKRSEDTLTAYPRPAPQPLGRLGLALTTCSERARSLYLEAIDRVYGAEAGANDLLDQALACDGRFALAHAARFMLAHGQSDRPTADAALEAALDASKEASDWERSHVACLMALVPRRAEAWATARAHLARYPQDLLVASQLIGDLFFHGREGKREAVMAVLRDIEPYHRGDWAFVSRLGFHSSELGHAKQALALLADALRDRPHAPFVAHAMAHALLESGERAASYRFLADWVSRHDARGPLGGHIHWHLALGELEGGDADAAVERYLQHSAPGVSECALGLLLADAGGLFARMALEDEPLDGMPRAQLVELVRAFEGALRIPFVAVHVAALAWVLDDHALLDRCVDALDPLASQNDSDSEQRVVRAFRSFADGDVKACVESLAPDRASQFETIGGSNEERALIGKLYARASARLSHPGYAKVAPSPKPPQPSHP